jgi:hypothetical protein
VLFITLAVSFALPKYCHPSTVRVAKFKVVLAGTSSPREFKAIDVAPTEVLATVIIVIALIGIAVKEATESDRTNSLPSLIVLVAEAVAIIWESVTETTFDPVIPDPSKVIKSPFRTGRDDKTLALSSVKGYCLIWIVLLPDVTMPVN